ncbi:MAG: enoyl-CoA hydratase/isomerase family protein [Gammaproteobacteria bacterium]|nr:enoyl-CoA hydratase/isomerase family protein [Gammaproteobacteria bacterium]
MSTLPDTRTLILEPDGAWLRIWLNRPQAKNALSDELVVELQSVLDLVAAQSSFRGVTIRGKGGVFCAGGDLKAFKSVFQGGDLDVSEIRDASRRAGVLFNTINSLPQVVAMLVDGAAVAGGLGMLCTGDVVAVTAGARFSLTETTLGIPPAQIAPHIVHRVGLGTARRLMLTGAVFDGNEAGRMGLADYVVQDAAGLDNVEASIRKQVLRCAPTANAVTKKLALAATELDSDEMIEQAATAFADCLLGEEGREGISSFIEKRKPSWAD